MATPLRSYLVLALALGLSTTVAVGVPSEVSGQSVGDAVQIATVAAQVDAACVAAWTAAGTVPEGPAPPLAVIRRLSLALTGAAPSLEEIRRFERAPEAERIDRYLETLLSSRRFSDYWAERLARAYVGVDEGPFLVFRRRRFVHWLSDTLHAGRPYDELVRDLVAGRGLWTDKPGTNFITAHERDPVRLTARSTRAFLGMRLDCAQCHDHPFAHWKQADFGGLAAHYAGVEQTLTGIVDGPLPFKPTGRMMMLDDDPPVAEPKLPFAPDAASDEGSERQQLARWITSPDNPAFGKAIANRVWAMMLGRALTRTGVDDIEGSERIPGVLAMLGADFAKNGHGLGRLIRIVAHTRAFRMAAAADESGDAKTASFAAFPVVKLRAEQIAGSLVQMSSLSTLDGDAHVFFKLIKAFNPRELARRYGDAGERELDEQAGTIGQQLVMMNGQIVRERVEANLFNAAGRIASLAPDDETRVTTAFLISLTRRPDEAELAHLQAQLRGKEGDARQHAMEDMLWALVNATEFSWNH